MRTLVAALLLVLLAIPAQAQMPTFTDSFQVRVGSGDIPTTDLAEPVGWSVEQRYTVQHSAGQARQVTLSLPSGATLLAMPCTGCDVNATRATATNVTWTIPASWQGPATFWLTTTQARTATLSLTLALPTDDAVAIVYAPNGMTATGPGAPSSPGSSTDGQATIYYFGGRAVALSSPLTLAVTPATAATTTLPATNDNAAPFPWLYVAVAFLLGALLWAFLVSRGMVQARSRKQVVQVAAHEAAAAAEPKPVLEARKRALMAALKELELAKMAGELDNVAYDTVKADLKKQTVTVMRALESS